MHEMALCEGLVEALEEQAKAQGFGKVHTVWLEIGALSTVEPEAMLFNFDIVTHGTVAEDARLEIIPVEGKAWCMQCAEAVSVKRHGGGCPVCGSYQLQILDGQQMRIKQIEVA
ncbi:MAG: hydrogenase maturation nickel metallochaperone HypA [Acidocella sp. 20-63-7]|nr:MAG: hydrogenase maturation nickel metallochaperone HypA [Acidocella sp. 20-63-7]HQT45788.1 hydrogenase maturation nickel metallochaperone HypA [Acidocella sp.]